MKYYRVKFGFGKDDFYSVGEDELPKAIRAQVNGSIFVCEEGTVAGNNIMSIAPDYNRALGVNRDYSLTGEDYDRLGVQTVKDYRNFFSDTKRDALGYGSPQKLLGG